MKTVIGGLLAFVLLAAIAAGGYYAGYDKGHDIGYAQGRNDGNLDWQHDHQATLDGLPPIERRIVAYQNCVGSNPQIRQEAIRRAWCKASSGLDL